MSFRTAAVAALIAGVATSALAAGPLSVSTRVMAERPVAAADGTTAIRMVTPAKVVPGDKLTVVVAYRNGGAQPIANLVLANPVPAGLRYRAPAPGSPAPELSVDGRQFGPLAQLGVAGPGGARRPAEPRDVTQVRWRLSAPVPAGAAGELAFQAIVQ